MQDTKEPFYQVPKVLLRMVEQGELTHSEVLIYMLMLDRIKYTKYIDEKGRYILITREELQKLLKIPKLITITNAIKKFEKQRLLIAKRSKGKATKYYL